MLHSTKRVGIYDRKGARKCWDEKFVLRLQYIWNTLVLLLANSIKHLVVQEEPIKTSTVLNFVATIEVFS